MKRILALLLCLMTVASLFASCARAGKTATLADEEKNESLTEERKTEKTEKKSETEPDETEPRSEESVPEFQKPASVVRIDLSKSDPSNSEIEFHFDAEHRVEGCFYKVKGNTIVLSYRYNGNHVTVYAFQGDVLMGMDEFAVQSFDPDAGFTEQNGYYFSGCRF